MLALTQALGQTMANGTILAVCRGQEPTALGMDRSLLNTLRRVYDSGSITKKSVKEEPSAVALGQIHVESGLAACYHELARRLAVIRRNMEILKAFQGVDLEKQSGCQLQTDIVLGMPLQYHTMLTALVPLHVGAVFHRQATKLADELEAKNKMLNKGATMSSVSELEELVQATTDKAARCDADAMTELRRRHGVSAHGGDGRKRERRKRERERAGMKLLCNYYYNRIGFDQG